MIFKHDGVEQSGYIAFLIIMSIFPFMIFFTFLIGTLGSMELGSQLIVIIEDSVPQEIFASILPVLRQITETPPPSMISFAFISIIWSASSIVDGLRTILNRAYGHEDVPPYLLRRILSIVEFFILTVTIIVSLFSLTILPRIIEYINKLLGHTYETHPIWDMLRNGAVFFLLFAMVSIIYYIIPNGHKKGEKIAPGAILTVGGWWISVRVFAYYLRVSTQMNLVYGSMTSIILCLIFFNILALILVYGAEFNHNIGRIYFKLPW